MKDAEKCKSTLRMMLGQDGGCGALIKRREGRGSGERKAVKGKLSTWAERHPSYFFIPEFDGMWRT